MSEHRFSAKTTRAEALVRLIDMFRRAGLDESGREARLVVCAAAGLSQAALISDPDRPLDGAAPRVEDFATRRASGEPLSKMAGLREFWGFTLTVSADVLDPRPETEAIVEAALAIFADRRRDPLRVLDLGVGSGALLCALLSEFVNALGLGVDVSAAAANVARGNIEGCGLSRRADIRIGDWTKGLDGPFDLIVSNPPYIRSHDIEGLPREVRQFDPLVALDGGSDGLDAYRVILPSAARFLAPGGWLLVEIGVGQAADVLALAVKAGFLECATRRDLAGRERVVIARSPRTSSGRAVEGDNRRERVNAFE
jgi:release factor glutamine methyltransferase